MIISRQIDRYEYLLSREVKSLLHCNLALDMDLWRDVTEICRLCALSEINICARRAGQRNIDILFRTRKSHFYI